MSSAGFPKVVVLTGSALLALWVLSFVLSYAHLGAAALPVALVIAATKAALVVMFFMELLRESLSMKLTLLAAGGLLAVLIGLMVADLVTREPAPLDVPGVPAQHTADIPSR
jgi:cytochrome c oxidase subunit 4